MFPEPPLALGMSWFLHSKCSGVSERLSLGVASSQHPSRDPGCLQHQSAGGPQPVSLRGPPPISREPGGACARPPASLASTGSPDQPRLLCVVSVCLRLGLSAWVQDEEEERLSTWSR